MKILDRKGKGNLAVTIKVRGDSEGERPRHEYLLLDNKEERGYIKFAAHMIAKALNSAVYRSGTAYFFAKVELAGAAIDDAGTTLDEDTIIFDRREYADESPARRAIDVFFGGPATNVFESDKIPRPVIVRDRTVLVCAVTATACVAWILWITVHKKPVVVALAKPVAQELSASGKRNAAITGSRAVLGKVGSIIRSVRTDAYARIGSLSVKRQDSPMAVAYNFNTYLHFLYPAKDTVSKGSGISERYVAESLTVGPADIRKFVNKDFNSCALSLLETGFSVTKRYGQCADLTYAADGAQTVKTYVKATDVCNVQLEDLEINADKGKLDVRICRD